MPTVLERDTAGSPSDLRVFEDSSPITEAPDSLPPVIAGTLTTLTARLPSGWNRFSDPSAIIRELYLPLAGPRMNGERQPMLASRWHDDTKQNKLIIELQKDAVWSNGVPVTSRDLSYTLFYLSDPSNHRPYQRDLIGKYITKVTEYDAAHIALHYPDTFDTAPDFLLNIRAMPAHAAGMTADMPSPVNGPYRPVKLDAEELILERQRDWWGNHLPTFKNRFLLRRIVFRPASEDAYTDFMQGQVDCISTIARTDKPNHWLSMINRDQRIVFINSHSQQPPSVSLITSPRINDEEHAALFAELDSIANEDRSLKTDDASKIQSKAEIIYSAGPTLEWLSRSNHATPLRPELLRSRIRTGFFEAAVVSLPAKDPEKLLNSMTISGEQPRIAELYNIPYYQYACWSWVALPEPGERSGNIISPLDINAGGYIGIDRRSKARVLGRPERKEDEEPVVVRYPAQ